MEDVFAFGQGACPCSKHGWSVLLNALLSTMRSYLYCF